MKLKRSLQPPGFASKLLHWFGDEALVEDLEGDLEELFKKDIQSNTVLYARFTYIIRVLSIIFSGVLRKRRRKRGIQYYSNSLIHPVMVQNYFKIAWRVASKNKVYSIINVLGLALGVCACICIYLIVEHENSFDKFHMDRERIYRLVYESNDGGFRRTDKSVPPPLAQSLRADESGFDVITGCREYEPSVTIPVDGNPSRKFARWSTAAILTEPQYFDIFKYSWLLGSPKLMEKPRNVVLTEKKAQVYFGLTNLEEIIGREIVYNDSLHVTVVGIVKDWTDKTDFPFTDFISYSTIESSFLKRMWAPDWNSFTHASKAFVKVKPGISPDDLSKRFSVNLQKHSQNASNSYVRLQPLSDIHFNPECSDSPTLKTSLIVLSTIAFFILILASINFINLSTAQSIRRSKEIGIRKVMGGLGSSLTVQFLIETLVLTSISVVAAAFLVNPVLSFFDSFIPAGVQFDPLTFQNLIFLIVLTFVTTLLAGLYPAKVLASYLPSLSLKGASQQPGGHAWLLRKGLIVFQFAFSLFFIIGALVMRSQLDMISQSDRGFDTDGVVTFWTNWDDHSNRPGHLVERIKQLNGVDHAALQGGSPMGWATIVQEVLYKGTTEVKTGVTIKAAGADYIPLYGIRMVAGRNIGQSDSLKEFVINMNYVKILGFSDPKNAIGEMLYYNGKPYPIVGVVDDFHQHSFREAIAPSAIGNLPEFQHGVGIKLTQNHRSGEDAKAVLREVEKLFKEMYPDETFNYHFIEEEISDMHNADVKTAKLVNVAMFITIFVSSLGVFGLVMFTAEIKIKEIAIRKVLGATVSNIAIMLSKEFVILLVIAMVIATPISWYYMSNWLMEFAFRIDMNIWTYVLALATALLIGLSTVSFHTLKAAKANPAKTLRAE